MVLTGAGKGFAGEETWRGWRDRETALLGENTIDGAIYQQRLNQRATVGKLFKISKPTHGALSSAAAGAGLSLALVCDMRIMTNNAIMTSAVAKVGFSVDYGGTYFMTPLVGSANERELYELSERVNAEERLQWV